MSDKKTAGKRWGWVAAAAIAAAGLAPTSARADIGSGMTGAGLLLQPDPPHQKLEIEADAVFLDSGHTKQSNFDFRLEYFSSAGRYRFEDEQKLGPRVGYDAKFLNLHSDDPALPKHLQDYSIGFGMAVAQFDKWWVAASVGVGYAGNAAFSDADAWYGKADIIVGREIWNGNLILALDYDGNRAFAPDIPLPGVAYQSKFNDRLSYVVGIPFSSVTWKPTDQIQLDFTYTLPQNIGLRAVYKFGAGLQAYAALEHKLDAFHIDQTSSTRRLFYEQERVEVGFRYSPVDKLSISLGVGYDFGQEFTFGFDTRNMRGVTDVSDEPYAKLQIEFKP